MGAEESYRNDDHTVIMVRQDILNEIGQVEDILSQLDAHEDAQQGRHKAEDIAPAVARDFRHAAQHFDDDPEDAVQDDNANKDE